MVRPKFIYIPWLAIFCQQVPDAVSFVHLPLHPKVLPPSVPPAHHLRAFWSGPQTWLPLLPLRSEKVAPHSHSSPGFSQRPTEAPEGPQSAVLWHGCWPTKEPSPWGGLCWHSPHLCCYCAKNCWEHIGQQWGEGDEGGRGVVCGEVSPAKCF